MGDTVYTPTNVSLTHKSITHITKIFTVMFGSDSNSINPLNSGRVNNHKHIFSVTYPCKWLMRLLLDLYLKYTYF